MDLHERLKKLQELPDNWGVEGNEKNPTKEAIAAAEFIINLVENYTPEPFIAPLPDGGIEFEFEFSIYDMDNWLIMTCRPDGKFSFSMAVEDRSLDKDLVKVILDIFGDK